MLKGPLSVACFFATTIVVAASEPTVVSCRFEKMPPMILTFRGGVGAKDNTLQIGETKPVALSVGSNLTTAKYGAQEFVFSLRLPLWLIGASAAPAIPEIEM